MMLTIDKLINNAMGLATGADNKKVFVPFALPNEVVDVDISTSKKDYSEARIVKVTKPSKDRIEAICPKYKRCGGCNFLHVNPENSAKYKVDIVKDNLERIGKLKDYPEIKESIYSDDLNYRVRCKIHVDLKGRKFGFLAQGSNEIIPVSHCPLLDDKLNALLDSQDEIVKYANKKMTKGQVSRKTGFVEVPLFAGDKKVSFGDEVVEVTIDDYKFSVSANVFFQSNKKVLPELFKFIKEEAIGNTVIDLYSGVGTFASLFEGTDKRVVAVEKQKECLSLARKNAPSAEFYTDTVENWVKRKKDKVGTLIIDPPRTGLDKNSINDILKFKADRIIYVSCNSVTLARDIALLTGYKLSKIQVFDFYYGTGHEEVATVLERI